MPLGPTLIGAAAFSTIKLVGYSLAGRKLNKIYKSDRPNAIWFGVVRTMLGAAVGACERKNFSFLRASGRSALGIPYSFLLDVPALLSAFAVPGGMWIC